MQTLRKYYHTSAMRNPLVPAAAAAKSDRINALIKKYDAFLEEEKNRKERNEFILRRLDKMRSCDAVVQFHHTANQGKMAVPQFSSQFCLKRPLFLKEYGVLPTFPVIDTNNQNIVSMNLSTSILNEDAMIREISKKYILIPKLGSVSNENIQAPTLPMDDNSDWQRKYDILKQLKQNEKDQDFTSENKVLINSDGKISQEYYDGSSQDQGGNEDLKTNENQQTKCAPENMPKKNVHYDDTKHQLNESFNGMDTDNKSYLEDKIDNTQHSLQEQIINQNQEYPIVTAAEFKLQGNINMNHTDDIKCETNYLDADSTAKVELQTNYDINVNVDDKNVDEHKNVNNEQFEPITYDQYSPADKESENSDAEKVVNLDEHNVSPIEVLNPEELVTQVNDDIDVENKVPDIIEYPIEVINTAEFTPHDNVDLQDGVNINPEVLALNQNEPQSTQPGDIPTYQYDPQSVAVAKNPESEDDVHTSQIEAFNDEQNEMFYSEQQNENYDPYNEGAADAFNTQYSDQNNAQGEQYQYYEGEQPYSTEINEHEETSERYDPNYEQQYLNNNHEQQEQQQQEYVQPSQQYEPEVYDETPQEFDRLPVEEQNYDPQQIEQQLDIEQDFSEVKTTQEHTEPVPDQ